MLYLGIVLLLIGVVLYFTVAPSLGGLFIVVGLILAVLGLVLKHRGRV